MAIQERDSQYVAKDETISLISSDKVEGTSVYNMQDEKLGVIDTLMIDKRGGQVRYAVLSFGGFLGIGNDHHPLPWKALRYDTRRDGYVVDVDKSRLEKAPHYSTLPASGTWARDVDAYWTF